VRKVIRCLKAIADENRARILLLLLERELSVCELMAVLQLSQPLVSRHLSILKEAGLVRNRKEGKLHLYSVTDETLLGGKAGFVRLLSETLEGDEKAERDRLRLNKCLEYQKKHKGKTMESLLRFSRQEVTP
jgi:ArsR family transcriptional regulator